MENEESPRRARRKARLIELLGANGGAAQVARESGTPKSHISAMVNGTRGLGDTLASKLEVVYGKPEGWFDAQIATVALAAPMPTLQASGGPSPIAWGADLAAQLDSLSSVDIKRAAYLECSAIIQRAKAAESQSSVQNQSSQLAA